MQYLFKQEARGQLNFPFNLKSLSKHLEIDMHFPRCQCQCVAGFILGAIIPAQVHVDVTKHTITPATASPCCPFSSLSPSGFDLSDSSNSIPSDIHSNIDMT